MCKPAIPGNTGTWISIISKDANNSGYTIDISNFDGGGSSSTVAGTVDSAGNLEVNPSSGLAGIHAVGKYVNDTIRLQFTTSSATGATFSCNMVMMRQN
jgi:hypothetical protein